jgi:hypothetical protein
MVMFLSLALPVFAQEKSHDLTTTTRFVEDLMDIQVTSVSKREQTTHELQRRRNTERGTDIHQARGLRKIPLGDSAYGDEEP